MATIGACIFCSIDTTNELNWKGSPKSCHLSTCRRLPHHRHCRLQQLVFGQACLSCCCYCIICQKRCCCCSNNSTTPQHHHVENFCWCVCVLNPSLTFLLAFKICALNWIHMGQWHVRDVWFYLRFVLMPVYILQSQSGTFGKHVLVVPWKPNVPKVRRCNVLYTFFIDFSSWTYHPKTEING